LKKPKQFKPVRQGSGKTFKWEKDGTETGRAKGYNKTWEKYRYKFLYYNPNCYACGQKANTVDHIVAHKGNQNLFWDVTNYIPMCHSCHSRVTGMFDKFPVPKTEQKMQWIQRQRELCGVNIRVKVALFGGRLAREIAKLK